MKLFAIAAGILIAAPAAALTIARATLPRSSCDVSLDLVEKLKMEKMNYREVAAVLGCDGVLSKRDDVGGTGQFVFEDYGWRLDAWPYGRFDGHFINGTLHGTAHRIIQLQWTPTKS